MKSQRCFFFLKLILERLIKEFKAIKLCFVCLRLRIRFQNEKNKSFTTNRIIFQHRFKKNLVKI